MSRSKSAILTLLGSLIISTSIFASASPVSASTLPQERAVTETAKTVDTVAVAKPVGTWITAQQFPSKYGSLSGISQAVYNNPGYWPGLCQYNHIKDCNRIEVGQAIYVPTAPVVSSVPASAPVASKPKPATATVTVANANTTKAQRIVNYALAQVGKRYNWASAGPNAFDCSGLVMMALAQVGISVPHQDAQILYSNQGVRVSRNNLQPGDIVWPFIGHVFIYIGNGQIVEAAGYSRGVIQNNLYQFYAAKRFV